MIARPPLVVPLVALAAFLALMAVVVGDWSPVERLDTALSEDLREYGVDHPDLVDVLRVATDVAATLSYVAAGVVAMAAFLLRRHRREAYLCAWVTVLVPALWGLMHWALHRPRPPDGFVFVDSNGFPSGHTSHAAAAALVAVLLLWPRLARRGRTLVVAGAAAVALFIGATRVLLLAHWPTDVLGGWLLALTVVPLAARAATARHGRE
ncbi:phosphatase PAP2 family protein [Phytohabitans sp. ZYX-F-186]|uniref:Phosphatase PAP2 family protein n=1 Tax=Phytohabitans maris TaxID=3071409 RepID=A0ABU0ZB29_9ACTN|nr:phosphatase PAP2 family protein [Phytohabitans sp. ZYX-F-186]MDQ7903157.1 phosphatase PAP2 family protein [Phytohabitans sp. ZYX-F-186]